MLDQRLIPIVAPDEHTNGVDQTLKLRRLALELRRPVALGLLQPEHAVATLTVALVRADRCGEIDGDAFFAVRDALLEMAGVA